ncbi:MAG: tetratricopeptide repeat protein [Clostridiales bacterium]|nr:tetratricopeptide repeat protein [Candidatus Blautia equi]
MKKKIVLALMAGMILAGTTTHAELNTDEIQKLDAYYTLASNYITKGDYEKAEEYVDACFTYCNEDTVSEELLADLYLKKGCIDTINGETDSAVEALDQAIAYQADLSDAYLVKIQILLDQMDYEAAVDNIQTYMELTGEQEMDGTLAQIYELMGDADKASETYETYIQSTGVTETEAAFENALYQMEIGLYDKAIENFASCMENEDYSQAASYNSLICMLNKGSYDEAEAGFAEGLEAGWDYDGIYYNLAVCKMMKEDYEAAIENYKTSREKESYQDESTRNIALCLMSQGDADGALEELTALIDAESPLADEARTYRASCYTDKEDYENALADMTACIENGYNLSQSYYTRAQIYKAMEEEDLYIADLEASVKPEE